jgi:TPP-dependent pyruvate/acetoin dehydrogenase alpha subunit/pyruvate/2-oxoglutarate/acetoin dehydrogenase E1 component
MINLQLKPKTDASPEMRALYEALFRQALLIRLAEERVIKLFPSDVIQSPVHLSVGQEAVAAAACAALRREDRVFSSYRSHAFYIAKGGSLKKMFAELYGKITGDAKGKAGSMHLTAPEVNFMGSSAIVASTIPHAVGAAYASRQRGEDRISLAVFGDGATEEGVYHESLNLAGLHKLPIVFLCENNGFAVHTRLDARHSYDILQHAASYNMPVAHVENGMDLLAVHQAVETAVKAARGGKGPQMLMVDTYRYKEHVGCGDDYNDGYRARAELDQWLARDPLVQDKALLEKLTPAINEEIEEAVAFAELSAFPGPGELLTDVDRPDPKKTYVPAASLKALKAPLATPMTYRKALCHAMEHAFVVNPHTIAFGQGIDDHKGIFGTTLHLPGQFGKSRVFDTPIAEEGVTGFGVGAALGGLYPIMTHIRTDFTVVAANQIVNLIAKYRYMYGGRFELPLLMRCVIGRGWGQGAQHSQSLQALFAHIPGLTVIMPSDPQSILETYPYLVEHYRGPVMSFEHRLLYDLEFETDLNALGRPTMPLDSRSVRQGKDVTIVATSIMVLEARRAAKHLQEKAGIECEIIDLHCVSHPNHKMILDSVAKTGRLVVADTSWVPYGVAAEVCRIVATGAPQTLKAPVVTLGMQQAPCPTGKSLEDLYYPNLTELANAVAVLATGKKNHGIELPHEKSMTDVYKRFKGPF